MNLLLASLQVSHLIVLIEVNINRIEMTTIFGLAKLHLYYVEESIGLTENKTQFKHSLFSCLS